MNDTADVVDIAIAGGGPVGTFLAHALAAADLSVVHIVHTGRDGHDADSAPANAQAREEDRPIALSWGSRLLLDRLGLWDSLSATRITRIHVSQQRQFGRTVIAASDHNVDALGYVVSYTDLCNALPPATRAVRMTGTLQHWDRRDDIVSCDVACGDETTHLRARLLVLADGGHGRMKQDRVKDYGQSAVVCAIDADRPQPGMAWERFTPRGPLALLPFRDRLALVWSSATGNADRLMALHDTQFIAELQAAFGGRLGSFSNPGPRAAFPLSLRYRRHVAEAGVIAIGNAAQTLHPVAGQGLNLGLRDAWELAEILQAGNLEPGSAALARTYAARRRSDRFAMTRLTDNLVGAFSLQWPLASSVRGAALAMLDCSPPLRRVLSRRMMFGARGFP